MDQQWLDYMSQQAHEQTQWARIQAEHLTWIRNVVQVVVILWIVGAIFGVILMVQAANR